MTATALRLREQVSPPSGAARRSPDATPVGDPHSTPAESARPIEIELLRGFARTCLKAAPCQLVLVCVLTVLATAWAPLAALGPGALLVGATLLLERHRCRRLLRLPPATADPLRWRLGLIVAECLQGVGWLLFALPLLALPLERGGGSEVFLLVAALLLAGAAAVLRSPIPSAVGAALAPLALILALAAYRNANEVHAALAFVVLSGQIFLAVMAHGVHRAAAATFHTRAQIRASFAELEAIAADTAEAYRRAEEADRAKTQFFETMGHELRTPLNAILGFSEVMKNEILGSHSTPSYREYSNDIHGSGQRLLTLINGILELSRMASGEYVLREERADLGGLVRTCLDGLATSAAAKSQETVLSVAPDLEPILVDPGAVRQIVAHLVSNAIKFTAPGGRIVVQVGWTSRGGQYVSVADDGPGIPAEEIPIVLSSFGRGSLALSSAEPGVGLGLPIARGLMELHGGRLILESTLRKGTQAVAVFPGTRCEAARRAVDRAPQVAAAA